MFDPIRSYDKPGVIISQLANGIATTESVRRVLFDPAALSPRERESFADRLKGEYGGNPVADTGIDVLTNPLVWLSLLTVGTGGVAARNLQAGRRFFAGGMGTAGTALFPILRGLKLTSGTTESIGRREAPLLQAGATRFMETERALANVMESEVTRLLEVVGRKHGVKLKSLDWEEAPNAAVARDLRDISSAIAVRRLGFHVDRREKVLRGVEPDTYHIRVYSSTDPTSGRRKYKTLQVSREQFEKVRDYTKGETGTFNLDLADVGYRMVADELPGFRTGETLTDTLRRRGVDRVSIKLGLKTSDVDPSVDARTASIDRASIKEGGFRGRFEEFDRPQYVRDMGALEAVEREFGLNTFNEAQAKLYEMGRVLLAGDEDAYRAGGGFVLDRQKVMRMARSQMKSLRDSGYLTKNGNIVDPENLEANEQLRAMLSDDVANTLIRISKQRDVTGKRVGMTADEIENAVVDALAKGFEDPYYMPRNTIEARDASGRVIAYNPYNTRQDTTEAPTASSSTFNRVRTDLVPFDPEDLRYIGARFGGTEELEYFIQKQRQRVRGQIENQNFYRVLRINPSMAASKYIRNTARDYAFFAHDASSDAAIRIAMRDFAPGIGKARLPGPLGKSEEGAPITTTDLGAVRPEERPLGGYSLYDLMKSNLKDAAIESPGDKDYVDLWERHIIPAVTGIRPIDETSHRAAATMFQKAALKLANSRFFQAIESRGGYGRKFVRDLRVWATNADPTGLPLFENTTRYLYGTHLGLNMGTVLLNLMQPLQSVHQLGFKNTVEAYGQAFDMMGKYAAARARLGPGASEDQVKAALRASFSRNFGGADVDLTEIADLGSTWQMMDRAGYGTVGVGNPRFKFLEFIMKPFQVSEMLNRTVTANAVMNAYQRAGRVVGDDVIRAQMDAMTAVQQFQFGTSPVNRPALFYLPGLREPMFRQFAQYGLRSFANMFTVPAMMGGTRNFAGKEVTGRLGVTLVDISRLLGVSALTYEIGKGMFGADTSRGLALGFTDIVGGQQAFQGEQPQLYIPPIVDLGWNAARFVATSDLEILQDLVPRSLPAGIALSRLVGTLPQSETLQAVGLQKTFVDWNQAKEGMAPVFKSDGRFMGQYPTSDIVLKSLGADFGRFSQPQELSQFLLKNRDAIREERRRYIAAVLGNNMGAASRVKAQFEKRFGLPLTVTQQQMKDAIKLREESVAGRTLGTIDRTARDVYQQAVAETLPGQLMGAEVPGPVEQGDIYRWTVREKTRAAGGGQAGSGRQQESGGG